MLEYYVLYIRGFAHCPHASICGARTLVAGIVLLCFMNDGYIS